MSGQNGEQKNIYQKIIDNRAFCLAWLIIGVVFITFFGALRVPLEDGTGYYPVFVRTASVIAMYYPKLYYLWVIFMIVALYLNIGYMYRRNNFESKIGKALMYAGFVCIIVTKIIPHEDDFNWRMVVHWSAALAFGVCCAGSVILFLYNKSKGNRRYLITLLSFIFVLAAMIVLLLLFRENGAIETLPIWCAYLILYLVNFTNIYTKKSVEEVTVSKEYSGRV